MCSVAQASSTDPTDRSELWRCRAVATAEVFSPRCMETDPSFREFETSLDGAITVSMVVVSQKDGQALREAARRGELVTASIQTAMTSPAFWSFPTVTLICMALSTLLVSTKWALQDARAAHDLALRAQMADEEGEGEEEAEEGERQGGAAPKDPPADAAAAGHPFEPPNPMSQMMLSLLTAGTFVVTASSVLLLLYLFPTALTHVFDVIYFCGGVAGVHQVVEPAIVAFVEFAKVCARQLSTRHTKYSMTPGHFSLPSRTERCSETVFRTNERNCVIWNVCAGKRESVLEDPAHGAHGSPLLSARSPSNQPTTIRLTAQASHRSAWVRCELASTDSLLTFAH